MAKVDGVGGRCLRVLGPRLRAPGNARPGRHLRGAVSIARRVQDPLAELVKIDPKCIGVGQYQHDLGEKKLSRRLAAWSKSA